MTYGPIRRTISDRSPDKPESGPDYLRQELIPAFKALYGVVRLIAEGLDRGSLVLGGFTLFVDPADGILKAKGPTGTITPIANP